MAHASGEVILSAGAINSPQILQLSGIGPAELLRKHGIDVVADHAGVGADLQDHFQVRFQYRCTEPITMNDVINSRRHSLMAGLRYILFRKGLLTIGAGYAGGFFRTIPGGRDARRAGAFHHLQRREDRAEAASVPGLHRLGLPVAPRQPRLRAYQVGRSGRGARDPAALHHRAERPRHHAGGRQIDAQHHGPARDAPLHRGRAIARAGLHQRCGLSCLHARDRHHHFPSDLDLPHGPRSEAWSTSACACAASDRGAIMPRWCPATPMRRSS